MVSSRGGCESLLLVLLGLAPAPVCWRIERERGKRQPGRPPQPSHSRGSHPAHRPRTARPGAETSPGLLAAREEVGAAADTEHPGTRHHDHRHRGCRRRRTGNHGESTGTGGGPRQRQHTESRQAPDRHIGYGSPRGSGDVKVVFQAAGSALLIYLVCRHRLRQRTGLPRSTETNRRLGPHLPRPALPCISGFAL